MGAVTLALIAGAIASGIGAFIANPTKNVKTRSQFGGKNGSSISILRTTLKAKGITGFYPGRSALVIGNIVDAGVRFVGYGRFKEKLVDFEESKRHTTDSDTYRIFTEEGVIVARHTPSNFRRNLAVGSRGKRLVRSWSTRSKRAIFRGFLTWPLKTSPKSKSMFGLADLQFVYPRSLVLLVSLEAFLDHIKCDAEGYATGVLPRSPCHSPRSKPTTPAVNDKDYRTSADASMVD